LAREETTSMDTRRDIRLSMLDVSWVAHSPPLPFNAAAAVPTQVCVREALNLSASSHVRLHPSPFINVLIRL
jgi:hypothetical protein